MCVCVYVCVYVCVCVCVWIDLRNFFSFLFSDCLVLFFSGLTSVLATPFVSSRRFSLFSELFETFSLSPSSSRGSLSLFQEVEFFREF